MDRLGYCWAVGLAACSPSEETPAPTATLPPTPLAEANCAQAAPSQVLDSGWRFAVDPQDEGRAAGWAAPDFDDTAWQAMAPGTPWEFNGVEHDGVAWYRSQLTLPRWEAFYLGFGGVDDAAWLYVDGQEVGAWRSDLGLRAAYLDLTPYVAPGESVTLALRIQDDGVFGGLKQSVRLGADLREVMSDLQWAMALAELNPTWVMPEWSRARPMPGL
ncbi:MAG: hypothetical protein HC915_16390 [Anaerolineae bacterium]|nr:hypothetical protein [Anaerolineae bacterium]